MLWPGLARGELHYQLCMTTLHCDYTAPGPCCLDKAEVATSTIVWATVWRSVLLYGRWLDLKALGSSASLGSLALDMIHI